MLHNRRLSLPKAIKSVETICETWKVLNKIFISLLRTKPPSMLQRFIARRYLWNITFQNNNKTFSHVIARKRNVKHAKR